MLKQYVLPIVFITSIVSCAQPKKIIEKTHAFNLMKAPGTIQTDANGNPASISEPSTIVYVEIKGKAPEWNYAWKSGKTYRIKSVLIPADSVLVGTREDDHRSITLYTSNGNKLYFLDLIPLKHTNLSPPKKINKGEIALQGFYKGKTFLYKISKQIDLRMSRYQ